MQKCIYLTLGGQPKGKAEMVEIDELSLKQGHHYVLLHIDEIDFYRRLVELVLWH